MALRARGIPAAKRRPHRQRRGRWPQPSSASYLKGRRIVEIAERLDGTPGIRL
jgi:hypothetical protein